MQIEVIEKENKNFPERLRKLKDCPERLYVMGNVELLNAQNTIAIIGSRQCTEYGRKVSYQFAKELSLKELCIISGMKSEAKRS